MRTLLSFGFVLFVTVTQTTSSSPSSKTDWSQWSPWSPCSRSCDGGVSLRVRHCPADKLDKKAGRIENSNHSSCGTGDARQEVICRMQPCPPSPLKLDFRAQQCAQYNDVPYEGQLYSWEPATATASEICSLVCRPASGSGSDDNGEGPVVRLAQKVVDGTRCRENSLDMCIAGVCRRVGCDLQLDSSLRVDRCGVCGGAGSSCGARGAGAFAWREVPLSQCSAPCGGGYMMAHAVCVSNKTGDAVDAANEDLCDARVKPKSRMAPCNNRPCPARWEVEDWGTCSKSCGGGVRHRTVFCVMDKDGKRIKVSPGKCPNLRPAPREACNLERCPQWYTGIWSACTVQCGRRGLQHRNVICRDARGRPSGACSNADKPAAAQPCVGPGYGDPGCKEGDKAPSRGSADAGRWKKSEPDFSTSGAGAASVTPWKKLSGVDDSRAMLRDKNATDQMNVRDKERAKARARAAAAAAARNESSTMSKASKAGRKLEMIPPPQGLVQEDALNEPTKALTEPSFIVEAWGACSSECGEGIRRRNVQCKIFLEFSKTVAALPDHKCPGPKPPVTEICFAGLCDGLPPEPETGAGPLAMRRDVPQQDDGRGRRTGRPLDALAAMGVRQMIDGAGVGGGGGGFLWKETGFTDCSESCLGGIQETKLSCVDSLLQTAVSPVNCRVSDMPEIRVQTCNDHPCPPRWNVSDFGACSRSCGGGSQTRTVSCIQEVRHGRDNVLTVDQSFCPQPPPITQQFCSVVDCPVAWDVGEWSKCSCDRRTRYRKVRCQQLLALGELAEKPESHCPGGGRGRPAEKSSCIGDAPCSSYEYEHEHEHEHEHVSHHHNGDQDHLQHTEIRARQRQAYVQAPAETMVKLVVGGRADLYNGTRVKIRCPVKHYSRSSLRWFKGNAMIRALGGASHRKQPGGLGNGLGGDLGGAKTSAFVTKKGALRIKSLTFEDAGTYSCMADNTKASIVVTVRRRSESSVNDIHFRNNEIDSGDFNDPLRMINQYNARSNWGEKSGGGKDGGGKDGGGGDSVYGVVKHLTDDPYSYDEFNYGRLHPTTPVTPPPARLGGSGSGSGSYSDIYNGASAAKRTTQQWDQHRLLATVSPRSPTTHRDGYLRFNTMQRGDKEHDQPTTIAPGSQSGDEGDGGDGSDRKNKNTYDDNWLFHNPDQKREREDNDGDGFYWDDLDDLSHDEEDYHALNGNELPLIVVNQKRHLDYAGFGGGGGAGGGGGDVDDDDVKEDEDEDARLEWSTSDWSTCSQTCGAGGKRVRQVDCVVVRRSSLRNDASPAPAPAPAPSSTEFVPTSLCLDSGLVLPETTSACTEPVPDCPRWIVRRWNKCKEAKCVDRKSALQQREVFCGGGGDEDGGGLVYEDEYCEAILKPQSTRSCYNKKCRAHWRTDQWSRCPAPRCGDHPADLAPAHQNRTVECVWKHVVDSGGQADLADEGHCTSGSGSGSGATKKRRKRKQNRNRKKKPASSRPCKRRARRRPGSCQSDSNDGDNGEIRSRREDASMNDSFLSPGACFDRSKYCGLVKSFSMCHLEKYQTKCCKACAKR